MAKEIHPTAIISPDVEIEEDTSIGPFCIIHDKVHIKKGTRLISNVIIEGEHRDRGKLHDIPVHQHRAATPGYEIQR